MVDKNLTSFSNTMFMSSSPGDTNHRHRLSMFGGAASSASGVEPSIGSIAKDERGSDLLPPDFVPGKWDVICQRGKECFDHIGNRRFRMFIDSHLDDYMKVKSRQQKSRIVTKIVDNIRKGAAKSGGGFVRKDLLTRRWFRVSDKLAREKVGQALRDAIKTRRASTSGSASSKSLSPTYNKKIASLAATDDATPISKTTTSATINQSRGNVTFTDSIEYPFEARGTTELQPQQRIVLPGQRILPLDPARETASLCGAGGSKSIDSLWSLLRVHKDVANNNLKLSSSPSLPNYSQQSTFPSTLSTNANSAALNLPTTANATTSTSRSSNDCSIINNNSNNDNKNTSEMMANRTTGSSNQLPEHASSTTTAATIATAGSGGAGGITSTTNNQLNNMFLLEPTPIKYSSSNQLSSASTNKPHQDRSDYLIDYTPQERQNFRFPKSASSTLNANRSNNHCNDNNQDGKLPFGREMDLSSLSSLLCKVGQQAALSSQQAIGRQQQQQQQQQQQLLVEQLLSNSNKNNNNNNNNRLRNSAEELTFQCMSRHVQASSTSKTATMESVKTGHENDNGKRNHWYSEPICEDLFDR